MKKILSFLLHPVVATVVGGSLGGLFSYLSRESDSFVLEIISYIFYVYPMILLLYIMIRIFISNIKSFKETLVYKKNKGTLSGKIVDSKGVPCKYFSVRVVNSDGSVGTNYSGRYMNMTGKNGEFKIHRLYNGDYIVKFYKGTLLVEIPFTISDDKPEVRIDYKFK